MRLRILFLHSQYVSETVQRLYLHNSSFKLSAQLAPSPNLTNQVKLHVSFNIIWVLSVHLDVPRSIFLVEVDHFPSEIQRHAGGSVLDLVADLELQAIEHQGAVLKCNSLHVIAEVYVYSAIAHAHDDGLTHHHPAPRPHDVSNRVRALVIRLCLLKELILAIFGQPFAL